MSTNHITDTTNIKNATAYVIEHTARLLRFHLNHELKEWGYEITREQWFLMFQLYENEGCSQGELADEILHDHPNITRQLDALEKRGYVERQHDPEDRRRHLIYLTADGRKVMDEMMPKAVETRKQLFAGISQEEVDQLKDILGRIEQNLLQQPWAIDK